MPRLFTAMRFFRTPEFYFCTVIHIYSLKANIKMKASMIQRSFVVAVFAAIALTVNAQHEHQTYNGPFGRDNAGTATYSYYTGDDGRRMFDGKYTYKRIDKRNGGSTYTETGQYKDDKLEGLWTLSFNGSMNGNVFVILKKTILIS